MSGIYGTRDVPARVSIRSKSSPSGNTANSPSSILITNGASSPEACMKTALDKVALETSKIPYNMAGESSPELCMKTALDKVALETSKIPYNMAGVCIERKRVRSGDDDQESDTDEERKSFIVSERQGQKTGIDKNCCHNVSSSVEESPMEKEVTEKNYNALMKQLATVLVEKETLAYQVQLLGQAYGEVKSQLTTLAERGNFNPSRLECLRNERCRLADYIISLSAVNSKTNPHQSASSSSSSPASIYRAQRDLWRNKFLASSLIVDELTNHRLFLLRQFEEAQQVVDGLLREKEKTRNYLFETFLYLQEIKETVDPSDHGKFRHLANMHTMSNLLEADQYFAQALHERLLDTTKAPTGKIFTDGSNDGLDPIVVPSEVEKQAIKIAAVDTTALASSEPCEDFQRLINERAKESGLPPPKMHNIVVNCCRRCEGQIKIV